jgi:hypothetical protein
MDSALCFVGESKVRLVDLLLKSVSSSRKFCLLEFSYRELLTQEYFSIHFLQEAGKKLLEVTIVMAFVSQFE